MKKLITKEQQDKALQALEGLVAVSKTVHLLGELTIISKQEVGSDNYDLVLTKDCLVKRHSWSHVAYDLGGNRDDQVGSKDEHIIQERLKEVITFFDLDAETILAFQKKLI